MSFEKITDIEWKSGHYSIIKRDSLMGNYDLECNGMLIGSYHVFSIAKLAAQAFKDHAGSM